MGSSEFEHETSVAVTIDEAIVGVHIMDMYETVVDFEKVLRFNQEELVLFITGTSET